VEFTMSAVLASVPAASAADPFAAIRDLVKRELAPKVLDVDMKAEYPEAFMRALGRAGGFAGAAAPQYGGNGRGLTYTIGVMEEVAKTCLSTGFLVWCQTAAARYIQMSDNEAAKRGLLPRLATGELLAGTGLSNTMKSCDEIEEYRLTAKRVPGGYAVNGVLPWVSNLGPDHIFVTGCPVEGEKGLAFVVVDCAAPDFKLVECAHFVALDGTRTLACHFKDTFIPEARVLAHPDQSAAYLRRIKPGMILAQMGMGLGLIDACAEMMRQSNRTHAHVNAFLDDQVGDIDAALAGARDASSALAAKLDADPVAEIVLDILKLRLAGGELSLRAANAALLHMGAKGYLMRSPAQRRLREAYFIAIVTPATKHLRKEIARLEAPAAH
jgi:alkylation response protein AidB-like acyl-CoA dehydrogenase